jgi:hypothetical protein
MTDAAQQPLTRADLDRELAHLCARLDGMQKERERALELQSGEYHRRLEELNNAHARAEKAVQMTVPRDLYDSFLSEYGKWKEEVISEFALLKGAASSNARYFGAITAIISILFSAMFLWLAIKTKTP